MEQRCTLLAFAWLLYLFSSRFLFFVFYYLLFDILTLRCFWIHLDSAAEIAFGMISWVFNQPTKQWMKKKTKRSMSKIRRDANKQTNEQKKKWNERSKELPKNLAREKCSLRSKQTKKKHEQIRSVRARVVERIKWVQVFSSGIYDDVLALGRLNGTERPETSPKYFCQINANSTYCSPVTPFSRLNARAPRHAHATLHCPVAALFVLSCRVG